MASLKPEVDVSTHFIFTIEDLDVGSSEPIGFFRSQTAATDVTDFWEDWKVQPWEKGKNLRLCLVGEYCSEDGTFYLYPRPKVVSCFYGKPDSGKTSEDLL